MTRFSASFVAAALSMCVASAHAETVPPAQATELARRLSESVLRPGGLTAEDAARRATTTSPDRRAKQADVDAADSEVSRVKVGYYPRVALTARYARLSDIGNQGLDTPIGQVSIPVYLNQYLLQAGLVVPLSDYLLRTPHQSDAASSTREAAALQEEATRRGVALQAKVAYYRWASVRLAEVVTAQSVEQARRHLEFSRAQHQTGRAPEADVFRAESLMASAELTHERTENAAQLAEVNLATLMHDDGVGRYEIGEDLLRAVEVAPGAGTDAASRAALFREAQDRRPELAALVRSRDSLEQQRRATNAQGLPRLEAFANAYLANPNQRYFPQQDSFKATWDVGVQLVYSPNDTFTVKHQSNAVSARERRLDAERAAVADAMKDEIAGAVIGLSEARVSADTAERRLKSAEEGYRVRRELFELGRGTSVEIIDAENDVLRARLDRIQAWVDGRVASVRLDHAAGRDGKRELRY